MRGERWDRGRARPTGVRGGRGVRWGGRGRGGGGGCGGGGGGVGGGALGFGVVWTRPASGPAKRGEGVVEGFLAHTVAGEEELFFRVVPDGEGEHAVQVVDAFFAPGGV